MFGQTSDVPSLPFLPSPSSAGSMAWRRGWRMRGQGASTVRDFQGSLQACWGSITGRSTSSPWMKGSQIHNPYKYLNMSPPPTQWPDNFQKCCFSTSPHGDITSFTVVSRRAGLTRGKTYVLVLISWPWGRKCEFCVKWLLRDGDIDFTTWDSFALLLRLF